MVFNFHFCNLLTSIFSSSFFWSISVILFWSSDGDVMTIELETSFLMQDWGGKQ